MSELANTLWADILAVNWIGLFQALMVLIAGLFLARLLARGAGRVAAAHLDLHQSTLIRRIVFYGLTALVITTALH